MAIEISTTGGAQVEMEDLFSIDGVMYQIPKVVPPHIFMAYMQDLRDLGDPQVAQARMLDRLIGADAVDALAGCASLQPEHLKALMVVVGEKAAAAGKTYGGN